MNKKLVESTGSKKPWTPIKWMMMWLSKFGVPWSHLKIWVVFRLQVFYDSMNFLDQFSEIIITCAVLWRYSTFIFISISFVSHPTFLSFSSRLFSKLFMFCTCLCAPRNFQLKLHFFYRNILIKHPLLGCQGSHFMILAVNFTLSPSKLAKLDSISILARQKNNVKLFSRIY